MFKLLAAPGAAPVRAGAEPRGRFAEFGLELHSGKTRLIEFGRNAARHRKARGLGKPETFDFLGFTQQWRPSATR